MALRNGQGQRKKYLALQLSSIKNLIKNMGAIVSEFQSAKIGVDGKPPPARIVVNLRGGGDG